MVMELKNLLQEEKNEKPRYFFSERYDSDGEILHRRVGTSFGKKDSFAHGSFICISLDHGIVYKTREVTTEPFAVTEYFFSSEGCVALIETYVSKGEFKV